MAMGTPEQEQDKQAAAERLREAVELAKYKTATDAAEAHGWPVSTFLSHCNGHRAFDRPTAWRYADGLRVRFVWLVTGVGPRRGPDLEEKLAKVPDKEIAEKLRGTFETQISTHLRKSH